MKGHSIYPRAIVKDADKLDYALASLGKSVLADRDIKQALKQIAKPLIQEMKDRTPVKSGTLRDSIGIITGVRSRKGKPFILVGPRYYEPFRGYHAHLVEVGRDVYNVNYEGVKMIFKAYNAKREQLQQDIMNEVLKFLERKIKRAGL